MDDWWCCISLNIPLILSCTYHLIYIPTHPVVVTIATFHPHRKVLQAHSELRDSTAPSILGLMITLLATCTVRTWLTVFPSQNPLPLDNVVCNSAIILLLWITLTLLCAASILAMVRFLNRQESAYLCPFIAHAGPRVFLFRLLSRLANLRLILMLFSVCYDICIGWFVYSKWVYIFPLPLQALELLPAIALSLQTIGQGVVLLFASACPVADTRINKTDSKECFRLLNFQMLLNSVLFFHPLTMIIIVAVTRNQDISANLFMVLAVLKLVYHVFSAISFHRIAKRKHVEVEMQRHKILLPNCKDTAVDALYRCRNMQQFCETPCKDAIVTSTFECCVEDLANLSRHCVWTTVPTGDCNGSGFLKQKKEKLE